MPLRMFCLSCWKTMVSCRGGFWTPTDFCGPDLRITSRGDWWWRLTLVTDELLPTILGVSQVSVGGVDGIDESAWRLTGQATTGKHLTGPLRPSVIPELELGRMA